MDNETTFRLGLLAGQMIGSAGLAAKLGAASPEEARASARNVVGHLHDVDPRLAAIAMDAIDETTAGIDPADTAFAQAAAAIEAFDARHRPGGETGTGDAHRGE